MHIFKSKKLRESRIPSDTSLWIICLEICPKPLYHNQGLKNRDISPKYRQNNGYPRWPKWNWAPIISWAKNWEKSMKYSQYFSFGLIFQRKNQKSCVGRIARKKSPKKSSIFLRFLFFTKYLFLFCLKKSLIFRHFRKKRPVFLKNIFLLFCFKFINF